jgi:hypothetical protein
MIPAQAGGKLSYRKLSVSFADGRALTANMGLSYRKVQDQLS